MDLTPYMQAAHPSPQGPAAGLLFGFPFEPQRPVYLMLTLLLILIAFLVLASLALRYGEQFAAPLFSWFKQELKPRAQPFRNRQRESQMTFITRALPCKVCYIDNRGTLVFTNHESYGVFEGLPMRVKLGDELFAEFEPYYHRCLEGKTLNAELSGVFGPNQIANLNFIPHYHDNGSVIGVICVGTDITEYRNVQRELSAAKEAADQANAAKTAFLANMSHEIRTPLGAVLGFSELLAKPALTSAERERYLDAIKRNGSLLKSLIDDILDISKVEAGKITLDITPIQLQDVFSDILSHLEVNAAQKGIEILLKPAIDLPKAIDSDPVRLRQILINIVGNAVKFTDRGQVEVRIENIPGTNLIGFHVKDSGCGISPHHAQDLFKPFYQGDSTTRRRYGGTGLGLVLSRRFARLLGGDVYLTHSALGEGSIFTITVNAAMAMNNEVQASHREVEMDFISDPYALQDISILIVEDAPDNQLLIGTYLTSAGANFEVADNGLEALKKLEERDFDIVIMDIQMPIMDGYETADELRRRGFTKPLIALTAHTMQEERDRCLAHGFEYHISKPINPNALLTTIKHLVFTNQDPKVYFEGKLSRQPIVSMPSATTLTITESIPVPRV